MKIEHRENLPENQRYFEENKEHFSKQCKIVLQALKRVKGSRFKEYYLKKD